MDSLTQMTLGAAVGEAVLGREVGRKAALWGAVLGTLPDLDVFIPLTDPVKDFTYHRSFSHSIFVLTLLTPLLVWLIRKLHPAAAEHKNRWLLLVWLVFMTHILIDCLTVYGTQIFWPFWHYPVGLGSVFIIDPFYTVPLLLGVICALVVSRENQRGWLINRATLAFTSLYLVWSLAAQAYVTGAVEQSLAEQSVGYENLLVTAGPFNTLLWRIVAIRQDGHYVEGFYSLIDGERVVTISQHQSQEKLLGSLAGHWPVERLRWFTKGYYKVSQQENAVIMTDLRMGAEPSYVFSFVVGEAASAPIAVPARQLEPKRDFGLLKKIWRRLWSTAPA